MTSLNFNFIKVVQYVSQDQDRYIRQRLSRIAIRQQNFFMVYTLRSDRTGRQEMSRSGIGPSHFWIG